MMQRLGFTTCALLVGALVLVPPTMAKDNYLPTAGPNQLLELSGQPALSEQRVERLAQTRDHRKRTLGPAVVAPPVAGKSVTVRGNQLIAMPGYILEKGPGNTVVARRIDGAPSTNVTAKCECASTGFCKKDQEGSVAVCYKDPGGPCQTKCEWDKGSEISSPSGGLFAQ